MLLCRPRCHFWPFGTLRLTRPESSWPLHSADTWRLSRKHWISWPDWTCPIPWGWKRWIRSFFLRTRHRAYWWKALWIELTFAAAFRKRGKEEVGRLKGESKLLRCDASFVFLAISGSWRYLSVQFLDGITPWRRVINRKLVPWSILATWGALHSRKLRSCEVIRWKFGRSLHEGFLIR